MGNISGVSIYTKMLNNSCLNCHYFRFAGFQRWCSHPLHHSQISNEYSACQDWFDMFSKGPLKYPRVPLIETMEKARESA